MVKVRRMTKRTSRFKEIMSYTFQKSHCYLFNTTTTIYEYISPRNWNFCRHVRSSILRNIKKVEVKAPNCYFSNFPVLCWQCCLELEFRALGQGRVLIASTEISKPTSPIPHKVSLLSGQSSAIFYIYIWLMEYNLVGQQTPDNVAAGLPTFLRAFQNLFLAVTFYVPKRILTF